MAPKADQDRNNAQLLAAAEAFEALTEEAFAAKPKKLGQLVASAQQGAHSAWSALSSAEQQKLNAVLSSIGRAQQGGQRHEVALAAVEGYRILVSGAKDAAIPTGVDLLDYAGFRYQADLRSSPIRWQDMQAAVQFANREWQLLEGRVNDASLKARVFSALAGMERAVANRSRTAAATEVKKELDLVDNLEKHFSR
jgi:hypothetical protein